MRLKKSFHVHGSVWRYGDTVEDLKGTARTLDGVNGKTVLESGLLSRGGYTVLDDSGTALVADSQWIEPRKHKGIDLYFFGYGHRYMECLRDFYRLSGHTPLLPRFALGNWWSRYHPYTEKEYLHLMDRFAQRQVPLTVATVDMDWHWWTFRRSMAAAGPGTPGTGHFSPIRSGSWTASTTEGSG